LEITLVRQRGSRSTSQIHLNEHLFSVSFVKQKEVSFNSHEISLCAHDREVQSESLSKYVSGIPDRMKDGESQYVIWVYVSGEYLDNHVNAERTEFDFADENGFVFEDRIKKSELLAKVSESLRGRFAKVFEEIEQQHQTRLEKFIGTEAPHYRPLLSPRYAGRLRQIAVGVSNENLEVELHRALRDVEIETREIAKKIQSVEPQTPDEIAEVKKLYERFLEEENALGVATLAKYVVHRKVIIDLFGKAIQLQESGKFALEEVVHGLVCPLGVTSNDMEWLQKQNLWLIDERLSHHLHLSSDKPLRKNDVVQLESRKEPDILVFNNGPHAFSDGPLLAPASAVIVEFKRPGKESHNKSPIDQVTEYIDKINGGKVRDKNGAKVTVGTIPYIAYVICDLSEDVEQSAKRYGLKPSADNLGWFGYLANWNCYCEVLSFNKILSDARKRNRTLFEKLNLI
jgi:hypothetical protein